MLPSLENSYRSLPEILYSEAKPEPVASPQLIAFNDELASELGLSLTKIETNELSRWLSGNIHSDGAAPIALAYAGHQFGGFSPQLGDGRAHLLGERRGKDGRLYDLQLKGSGRTPYSRGGDGRSSLGPVLREYLVSEAMHVLGVPTTRALAAVSTGEVVHRETLLPGAVLTRVASCHLRVGTFEFLSSRSEHAALTSLVDYALLRLYPHADKALPAPLRLLDCVMDAQASLIAQWMGFGFIHGVMNTDNSSISGETIDYGPCAFMDTYESHRKFSSIDRASRYAYDQQAKIGLWNLARLAEALLPIVDSDESKAVTQVTELLQKYPARYERYFGEMCARKLGLGSQTEYAASLMTEFFTQMQTARSDFTMTFRHLYDFCENGARSSIESSLGDDKTARELIAKFESSFAGEVSQKTERLAIMKKANPLYIPRNHRVEEVIAAALEGDYAPFFRLQKVLLNPWEAQPEALDLALPPGDEQFSYKTFCGT